MTWVHHLLPPSYARSEQGDPKTRAAPERLKAAPAPYWISKLADSTSVVDAVWQLDPSHQALEHTFHDLELRFVQEERVNILMCSMQRVLALVRADRGQQMGLFFPVAEAVRLQPAENEKALAGRRQGRHFEIVSAADPLGAVPAEERLIRTLRLFETGPCLRGAGVLSRRLQEGPQRS